MSTKKVLQKISEGIRKKGTAGAFREQAHEAGMTTAQMASMVHEHPEDYSTKTKHRANLARTFQKYRPH